LNTNVEERKWKVDGFPPSAHTFLLFFLSSKEFLLIDVVLLLSNESLPPCLTNEQKACRSCSRWLLCVWRSVNQTELSLSDASRLVSNVMRNYWCTSKSMLSWSGLIQFIAKTI
jgi:hypothetical protein